MSTVLFLTTICALGVGALANRNPVLRDGLFEGDEFTPITDFTDEFWGSFDHDKWYNINPRWKGRQPGLFATKNVKQKRGKLFLKGRYEGENSTAFDGAPDGYETYTTSYVMSKKSARYGYFEVKAKPSNSRLSSSFWGSLDTPTKWTEIDVFELGGAAQNKGTDFRRRINMNLHVFRNVKKGIEPGKNQISKPAYYTHSSFLRSRFNVYGLDWSKKWITWTFNGRAIRRERNKYWKQAIPMKFDVETMPNWFGLPSEKTLPATYKIEYIRTWSRTPASDSSNVPSVRNSIRQSSPSRLGEMFGFNSPAFQAPPPSEEEDFEDEDDDEANGAETEVFPIEPQTNAPQDGLQRAPIPGSNEVIYSPVLPAAGWTWQGMVQKQNQVLDDVFGAEIVPGEGINVADFDEELLMFANPGPTSPAQQPTGLPNAQDTPTPILSSSSAPQQAPAPGSAISDLKNGKIGFKPSIQPLQ